MFQVVIRVLPFVALFFLVVAWIFCIVGAGSFNRGWAIGEDDDSFEVGWQKDVDMGSLGPGLEAAGKGAFIGNVIAFTFLMLSMVGAISRGLGVARSCACFGAGTAYFAGGAMFLSWTIWLDRSESARDSLGLIPHYAFWLTFVACFTAWIGAVILSVSFCKDFVIFPRNYRKA